MYEDTLDMTWLSRLSSRTTSKREPVEGIGETYSKDSYHVTPKP